MAAPAQSRGRWGADPLALPNVRGTVLRPRERVDPLPDGPAAARRRPFRWPPERRKRPRLQDAIGDLPIVGGGQTAELLPYDGPLTAFQRDARRGVPPRERSEIHDHWTRAVRQDDAKAFSRLKPGGTYRDLPSDLQRYRADIFDDKYKRLEWDGLSVDVPRRPRSASLDSSLAPLIDPSWAEGFCTDRAMGRARSSLGSSPT